MITGKLKILTPQVSIGLPAYNGEKYIAQAISSAFAQTYTDFELIISDDGSSDQTIKIVEQFRKKDQRIKLFRQKTRLGFRNNFNFVLQKAKGEFFVWLAQDDYWNNNYLSRLFILLDKRPDAALAASGYSDVKGNFVHKFPLHNYSNKESRAESLKKFIRNNDLSFYYGLFRRKFLLKTGGYLASSRPFFKSSDYLTIFKVLCLGPMLYAPEYLFFKTDTGSYLERYKVLKILAIDKEVLRKILRYLTFPIGFLYDMVGSIKILVFSDFTFIQKFTIFFSVIFSFLRRLFLFFSSLIFGFLCLTRGILRKLNLYQCINTLIHFMNKVYHSNVALADCRILAFMNSFSEGSSGGDIAFIEIFKRLKFKKLTVVTSLLGKNLCIDSGLRASYVLTSDEKRFGKIFSTYFRRILKSVFSLWRAKKFDLIYSSSDALPDVLPAFLLKIKNPRVKWVVKRYHDIPRDRFIPYFFQRLSLLFAKCADLIIQNGRLGFDANFIDQASPSSKKYDAVFVSRLHPSKGIYDLIEVWKKVVFEDKTRKLAIIGHGSEEIISDLKNVISDAHLENNIDFLGFLPDKEKFSLMKSAKLFVFPSHEEAFSLIMGEALLCKLSFVTFALPGLKWCSSCVFKVPCFEKKYFSRVVRELLRNEKKRMKNVERGYEFVKGFTWEKAARNEEELIYSVL